MTSAELPYDAAIAFASDLEGVGAESDLESDRGIMDYNASSDLGRDEVAPAVAMNEDVMPDAETAARNELEQISIFDVINFDPHPTFVADLKQVQSEPVIKPVFRNASLSSNKTLTSNIEGIFTDNNSNISWAYRYFGFVQFVSNTSQAPTQSDLYMFQGFNWTRYIAFDRWIVITASPMFSNRSIEKDGTVGEFGAPTNALDTTAPTPEPMQEPDTADYAGRKRHREDEDPQPARPKIRSAKGIWSEEQAKEKPKEDTAVRPIHPDGAWSPLYDWTTRELDGNSSKHLKYARETDWANTPLGPISTWPAILRAFSNLVMISPDPAVLFWGESYIMIFNERYKELIGPEAHAMAMGTNVFTSLPQYAAELTHHLNAARFTGYSSGIDELSIYLSQEGRKKKLECYVRVNFIPIIDETGRLAGYYQTNQFVTPAVQAERRLITLSDLCLQAAIAEDHNTIGGAAADVLKANQADCILALVYTSSDSNSPCYTQNDATGSCDLAELTRRGIHGIDKKHSDCPTHLKPKNESSKLLSAFKTVCMLNRRLVLSSEDGTLPTDTLKNTDPTKPPLGEVVIEPLRNGSAIFGFLVLGTHPTTEVNDKYLEFVSTAASLLGTWLGSSNLIQTLRTREEQFKEDKSKLAITCDELRKQLDNQEKLLGHFANGTSVGIFMANPHGQCAYRNSGFNNIFRFPDGDDVTMHLVGEHCIDPEYLEKWLLAWKAVEAGKATTVELRLKRTWKPPHDGRGEEEEQQAWVMLSGFPEMGVDGDVGQLMGSVTDVSELKWRVECQERLTTEALESKRRLENFIDTTNHELRNPLSAISHAGEDIIRTSSAVLPGSGIDDTLQPEVRALLADVADSAKTVMLGARHQKRIIDDVLTASRLDSNLLSICPEIADPENELRSCVEMCKFESLDDCVDVRVVVCDSYRRHATTALKFDATRFNQVCVNLMMNAIRSSAFEPVRQVTIALEASPTEPLDNPTFGVQYFARSGSVGAGGSVDDAQQLAHEEEQWGAGASVYLVVTVVDTGRGISDEQVKVLFTHFGQVSPRTHVRYGGNGLGLFISRRLTEMQGGRIGFKTAVGKGSTFSFYVRARRATDVLALEHAGGELRLGGAVAAPAENVAGARAPNGDCAAAAAATTTTNGGPVGGSWCAELSPPAEGVRRALALAKLLEGQDPARPSPIAVSVAPRMPRRPQSLSIMVVEDNAVNQKVLVKGLRKMGCKVLVANNGAEALAMLAETRWCRGGKGGGAELTCMLLDWEMPVMDGLTCVAKIREMERRGEMGHLPVMGLTANARPAQLKQATEAGMDDAIAKPIPITILIQKISNMLDALDGANAAKESS